MRKSPILIGLTLLLLMSARRTEAALIAFSSEAAFDLAAGALTVETFESGLVSAGGVTTCTGPVSSAAGSTCFPVGGLAAGASYDGSGNLMDLALLSANFAGTGTTSKTLGANAFPDTTNIAFTSTVNAVGFDVFAGPVAGNVLISFFDPANVPLGSFTIFAPIGGTFFGVISTTDLIGRVNLASLATVPGELVDNVAFGSTAPTQAPEPTTMLLLGIGLAGTGVRRWRQRRA